MGLVMNNNLLNSLSIIIIGTGLVFNSIAIINNSDDITMALRLSHVSSVCVSSNLSDAEIELCEKSVAELKQWQADNS